jgi:hypothetical protein
MLSMEIPFTILNIGKSGNYDGLLKPFTAYFLMPALCLSRADPLEQTNEFIAALEGFI